MGRTYLAVAAALTALSGAVFVTSRRRRAEAVKAQAQVSNAAGGAADAFAGILTVLIALAGAVGWSFVVWTAWLSLPTVISFGGEPEAIVLWLLAGLHWLLIVGLPIYVFASISASWTSLTVKQSL